MGFITPPGGWDDNQEVRPAGGWVYNPTMLPRRPQEQPAQQVAPYRQEQPPPAYVWDPSVTQRYGQSFVDDLRGMGGREAGNLTFGAVFGATSGFFLARFLMTLLKIGVVIAILVGFALLARLGGSASSRARPASDPVSMEGTPVRGQAAAFTRPVTRVRSSGAHTYVNDRFGFRVTYPGSFIPQPEPENGDGRSFVSADGLAAITVSGSNMDGRTFAEEVASIETEVPGILIARQVEPVADFLNHRYPSYGVSWQNRDTETAGFDAGIIGPSSKVSLRMSYPINDGPRYASMIESLINSLRSGDLDQAH